MWTPTGKGAFREPTEAEESHLRTVYCDAVCAAVLDGLDEDAAKDKAGWKVVRQWPRVNRQEESNAV